MPEAKGKNLGSITKTLLDEKVGDDGKAAVFDTFSRAGWAAPFSFPLPTQVREDSTKLSSEIFKDQHFLRGILERHEATIHKRWRKKTTQQRRNILLGAWPNMSQHHRPDFEALGKEPQKERTSRTKFKEAYMWPYVNLEDLLKPRCLLLFLNSRGRHPPHAFILADYNAIHVGIVAGAVHRIFLRNHIMTFANEGTPQMYGKLVPWKDDISFFQGIEAGVCMGPERGMIILEIQQKYGPFWWNAASKSSATFRGKIF